jgi:hypothetical protein
MSNLHSDCQNSGYRATASTVPGTTVRLLTQTSKMPSPSWSLPARKACPRARGTICQSCYASRGCFRYPSTRNAQQTRLKWTVQCMRTPEARGIWVETMVDAIQRTGSAFFRVHDSGDMFSTAYAGAWFEVCQGLPAVQFWIPTRGWQRPNGDLPVFDPLLQALRELAMLPNVTVRPSALNFGDCPPQVAGLHADTTADCDPSCLVFHCPSSWQGGKCLDCRVCWSKDIQVSYKRH